MLKFILDMNPIGIGIVIFILVVFFGAFVSTFQIKHIYKKLSKDLAIEEHRHKAVFRNKINNAMTQDFKKSLNARILEINTQAIVDKQLNAYLPGTHVLERFVSKAPGLMIVLGLVGTFFGLSLAISDLVDLLKNTPEAVVGDVTGITGGLLNAINGMAVAFITSLFGIAASIIFNLTSIFVGTLESKNHYIASAEEYLDNVLGPKNADMTLVDESGRTPLEIAFEELGDRLSTDLRQVTESVSQKLVLASESMKDTALSLENQMDKFEKSVELFSENTRDFSEFNHQLKNNIQRLSLAFDDATEKIKS